MTGPTIGAAVAETLTRSRAAAADARSGRRDRREQILKVAARLFAEYGFETTSVRQIADEVTILAGSLYHHFATKEDMLHAILREPLERITAENLRVASLPVDAEQRLVASMVMRFRDYLAQWELLAILQQESRFFRRHKDFAYVQEAKTRSFGAMQRMFQDGIDAGLFRQDLDAYLMIGTLARLLSSAAAWLRSGDMYSSDRGSPYSEQEVIDFQLDLILKMVRPPHRATEPIPHSASLELAGLLS
jgi:AcrR family transcriptional regulator